MDQLGVNSESDARRTARPEELERVPLKQRLKLLLAGQRASVGSDVELNDRDHVLIPNGNASVGEERESGRSDEQKSGSLTIPMEEVNAVKIENTESIAEGTPANHLSGSSLAGIDAVAFEPEMSKEYLDELDHVALTERLRRHLMSKSMGLTSAIPQESTAASAKGDLRFGDQQHVVSKNQMHEIERSLTSGSSMCTGDSSCKTGQGSTMPTLATIKIEHSIHDKFQISDVPMSGQMSSMKLVQVKSEVQNSVDESEDELDHMLLRERMKLLSSGDCPNLDINSKTTTFSSGFTPVTSRPTQSLKINRRRKKRKTVTDSVETAMEEDAPGLLKVLIEKGVSVNEIKLYGEPESNDSVDDSSTNNGFAELEEIISKVFSQRETLLKFAPLRCNKGERASYCLECLFSLVEQARYLRFRNWPVEWGWCRDIQSFIFVFERHNRIVLERPEYGYATYFFELAEPWPIAWQIERLVTAMKLTSCGRLNLIENKPLMVGNDLTEGEGRVLEEYGWLPNTGLGTMLNYYDRVVHDRKSEDKKEWRSKIGKLLMDGYNGGTIISTALAPKVEYDLDPPADMD